MNILILSVGTRNKVIEYYKNNIDGKIIATDCSNLAPALYIADKYYIVKRMTEDGYLDQILEICRNEKVDAVFSLIDPELQLLADNVDSFKEVGVLPIISDKELIQICNDKFLFYNTLASQGFKTIKTFNTYESFLEEYNKKLIHFPVFIKPRYGSASIGISKVEKLDELELIMENHSDLIIQEYCPSQEFGVDVYIDLISKKIVGYFSKLKVRMRAGETDKSISYDDPYMRETIEKFCEKMGFVGFIDIDVFKSGEDYIISEVNPRFGGGYVHAYEMGINFPELSINNILGIENNKSYKTFEENIAMLKYSDVIMVNNKSVI